MMDTILPRVDGVTGALPTVRLLDPVTRLPTDDAEHTSLLRGAIDPIERDLAAADHIRPATPTCASTSVCRTRG